jgi:hypothetical protein
MLGGVGRPIALSSHIVTPNERCRANSNQTQRRAELAPRAVSGVAEPLSEVPKLGKSTPASVLRGTSCASGVQSNGPRSSPFPPGTVRPNSRPFIHLPI